MAAKSKKSASSEPALLPTRHDLAPRTREKMVELLNQHLADAFDLLSQTKQAHWNVQGMQFIALHKLFDEFAESLEDMVDTLAERVTALGGVALGTVRLSAAASRLPEFPLGLTGSRAFVDALAERYALWGKALREAIDVSAAAGDADSADLFTELSRDIDKFLWFLEAHLRGE